MVKPVLSLHGIFYQYCKDDKQTEKTHKQNDKAADILVIDTILFSMASQLLSLVGQERGRERERERGESVRD